MKYLRALVAPTLRGMQASFGTPLEPLHALETSRRPSRKKILSQNSRLGGGRTRTRTLDPLIKSQLVPAVWAKPRPPIAVRPYSKAPAALSVNSSPCLM
jgi:hypothetical protein